MKLPRRNSFATRFDIYDDVYFEHKGQTIRGTISDISVDPYGGGWYYDLLVNNDQYGQLEKDIWR